MTEKVTRVVLDGDASGVVRAFSKANDSIGQFHKTVESKFSGIGKTFGGAQKAFLGFAAALGGGALFKNAIDETVKFEKENKSLARTMGITGSEASILNIALGDIYQDADAFISSMTKMSKGLAENEEKFTAVGIKTRDASGNLLSMQAIFDGARDHLLKFTEGTDRNVEGAKLFGKAWGPDIQAQLKLTKEVMEEARVKAEALGLVMTEQSTKNVSGYRAAMNDVGDVLLGIKNAIAQAVMPVLAKLGEWFASVGPAAVVIIKGAIGGLVAVFWGLENVINMVMISIKALFRGMLQSFASGTETMSRLMAGDFKGALASIQSGLAGQGKIWDAYLDDIVKSNEEAAEKIANLFVDRSPTAKKEAGESGDTKNKAAKKPKADSSRMAEWDAIITLDKQKLAELNAATNQFHQYDKQKELQFWRDKRALTNLTATERYAVEKKITALMLDQQKERYDTELAGLQAQQALYKNNLNERSRALTAEGILIKSRYGLQSKEYQDHQKKLNEFDRERAEQKKQLDNLVTLAYREQKDGELQIERDAADQLAALGLISKQQRLQQEIQFVEREAAIKRAALDEQLADMMAMNDRDVVEEQKLLLKKEAMERAHQAKMRGIKNNIGLEQAAPTLNIFGAMQSQFQTAIDAMTIKFQGFRTTFNSLAKSMYATFMQEMITKPLAAYATRVVQELAMHLGLVEGKVALDLWGSVQSGMIAAATAIKNIAIYAWEAAAGAYAAIASIPYVGPFLAPAMAAGAFLAVGNMAGNIFSAAGGMDIPAGLNPMVQTHEREMILPADLSDGIRNMIAVGGGAAAGSRANVTINATMSGDNMIITKQNFSKVMKELGAAHHFVGMRG
jgi:hypothetical protein